MTINVGAGRQLIDLTPRHHSFHRYLITAVYIMELISKLFLSGWAMHGIWWPPHYHISDRIRNICCRNYRINCFPCIVCWDNLFDNLNILFLSLLWYHVYRVKGRGPRPKAMLCSWIMVRIMVEISFSSTRTKELLRSIVILCSYWLKKGTALDSRLALWEKTQVMLSDHKDNFVCVHFCRDNSYFVFNKIFQYNLNTNNSH